VKVSPSITVPERTIVLLGGGLLRPSTTRDARRSASFSRFRFRSWFGFGFGFGLGLGLGLGLGFGFG
jgi:hypothetical protein